MRKTRAFEKVNVDDVAAKRAGMGMPIRTHGLDVGQPGRYYNSHAEKQAELINPDGLHTVSRETCDDCVDFFGRLATHDNQVKRDADPNGLNVFHPGGKREVLPYEDD
ncbi:hypothetical protein QQM39_26780 [Streptomyces sp. DT2A-34]|uniref:hypothetical protein n=1 Tax=Streptomyces sp. DT2A-34 TaxID=3051182 RepID=UPI00265BFF20|nr:hypothetical protein [Streptomyces sp. DT2A-34]MDO0914303.1 hypothetical protein [Streptomyces sp. DT2A-34]